MTRYWPQALGTVVLAGVLWAVRGHLREFNERAIALESERAKVEALEPALAASNRAIVELQGHYERQREVNENAEKEIRRIRGELSRREAEITDARDDADCEAFLRARLCDRLFYGLRDGAGADSRSRTDVGAGDAAAGEAGRASDPGA